MASIDCENETAKSCRDESNIGTQMPVILAIDDTGNKRRGRRKYTTTDKVIQRNKVANEASVKKLRQNQQKLQEYEILKTAKTLTKEDAKELFSSVSQQFNQVEAKLEAIAKQQVQVPSTSFAPLETISEDPTGYTSDSQKRFSDRFVKRDVSPAVNRLNDRFKRF